ncbi:MAG: ester cyclase [Saprospiraceae bacterium]|nr:ester cyclase [Saprospiraceae bacterium]
MKSFKMSVFVLCMAAISTGVHAGKLESSVRNFWSAVDMGDFDKAAQYLSSDIQVFMPLSPTPLNLEAYKGVGMAFRTGFPDIQHKIAECTEGTMTLAVRGLFLGTNTGSLMGNPPTGNRVELPFLQYWTFDAAGKAIRIEIAFDLTAFNAQLMKGVSNKDLANTLMAELNKHNLNGVIKNCASDAKFYGWEPQAVDAEGYRKAMMEILDAFPDAKFLILDVIAEGDKVVVRHQLEGTHTGAAFKGVSATNRKIVVPATVIFQFRNGKATDLWLNADALGMMIQLGAFPVSK